MRAAPSAVALHGDASSSYYPVTWNDKGEAAVATPGLGPLAQISHGNDTEEWLSIFKDPEGRLLALMAQVKR